MTAPVAELKNTLMETCLCAFCPPPPPTLSQTECASYASFVLYMYIYLWHKFNGMSIPHWKVIKSSTLRSCTCAPGSTQCQENSSAQKPVLNLFTPSFCYLSLLPQSITPPKLCGPFQAEWHKMKTIPLSCSHLGIATDINSKSFPYPSSPRQPQPWSAEEMLDGQHQKNGHPCPYQHCSKGPPAEKTGRGSLLNRPSFPPSPHTLLTQSVKRLNWTSPLSHKGPYCWACIS